MAYISSDEVKQMRFEIKKAFPSFKFSVVTEHHMTVRIRILSGNIDLGTDHTQVNEYRLDRIENDALRKMSEKILQIIYKIKPVSLYETADYGDQPNFYVDLQVGKWDQPYALAGKELMGATAFNV